MSVYFIGAGEDGDVKIGFTRGSATDRLRALQTGHPECLILLGVVDGTEMAEKECHRRLAHARLRDNGEWFQRGPALELLAQIQREQDAGVAAGSIGAVGRARKRLDAEALAVDVVGVFEVGLDLGIWTITHNGIEESGPVGTGRTLSEAEASATVWLRRHLPPLPPRRAPTPRPRPPTDADLQAEYRRRHPMTPEVEAELRAEGERNRAKWFVLADAARLQGIRARIAALEDRP